MNELLSELIAFLKNASPEVWNILMKQVYSDGAAGLFAVAIFAVILAFSPKLIKHGLKLKGDNEYSMWELWVWFGGIAAFISIFVIFIELTAALQKFYNPEFYAIQYLIEKISG